MPQLDRFRAEFSQSMSRILRHLAELEKAGDRLHHQVGAFQAR